MQHARPLLERGVRVVDLSADFRFPDPDQFERAHGKPHTAVETLGEAAYGLSELNREAIRKARLVANPGCYVMATCLAMAPLLEARLVDTSSFTSIFALNGMSGAASEPRRGIMHADVFGSVLPYNLSGHRHATEIETRLERHAGEPVKVDLTTAHGNFVRGIYAQASVPLAAGPATRESLLATYLSYYGRGGNGEAFVRVNDFPAGGGMNEKEYDIYPAVKDVAGSNLCHIGLDVDERVGRAKVVSVIDNLVKGAAGSAIQNMNLMLGLPEAAGLGHYGL
jgi:N-acetyl-gamma-glutamyl-phosphate reductase common form